MIRPIVLTGPTAIGKTAVALSLARRLPLHIISADSMQVYRRLDIGTAKPTPAERAQAPHECLDLAEPVSPFSVGEYLKSATAALHRAAEMDALPLIVGGTRLYIHALSGAFDAGPPPQPAIRSRLTAEAAAEGTPALHRRLGEIDPATADRLHPNDAKRIIRALEVYEASGRPLSAIQEESRERAPLMSPLVIALVDDRETLYQRVEARTAAMLQGGWLEEVEGLLRDGFGPGLDAIKAHGYPELAAYLRGETTLAAATEQIKRNIRHYVRYQLGWIRHMRDAQIVQATGPLEAQAGAVEALVQRSAGP